jgi:RNA polymerase sigma factor (sigma-70 family)
MFRKNQAFTNVAQGLRAVAEKLIARLSSTLNKESFQSSKLPSEDVENYKAEFEIEITIKREFDTYTRSDEENLLRAIRLFLEMDEGELKITKKRRGSVKLTLNLPRDKAEKLFHAIKSGHFEEYGAVDAELKELQQTAEAALSSPRGNTEFTREIDWNRLQEDEYRQEVMAGIIYDYTDIIMRYCAMRLGKELAVEVTQDVFIRAWQGLSRLQTNVPIRAWLLRIASTQCQQLVRNLSRRQAITRSFLEGIQYESRSETSLSPEHTLEAESLRTWLRDALSKLPETDRMLLALSYSGELSSKDIAEVMGISANVVRQRLARVRALLRAMMRDKE